MKNFISFFIVIVMSSSLCAERHSSTIGPKNNIRWVVDTEKKTLTFSGKGEMDGQTAYQNGPYVNGNAPWYQYRNYIQKVIINEGITTIGQCAFWGCENIMSILLPTSLVSIESEAFFRCENLTDITIPENVKHLGWSLFANCYKLKEINIPASVTDISTSSLSSGSITSINVVSNNSKYCSIDGVLFSKDKKTLIQYPLGRLSSSYVIPTGVTTIAAHAFESSYYLSSVTIPNSVSIIKEGAFYGCKRISSIIIPSSVMQIEDPGTSLHMTHLNAINVNSSNSHYCSIDGVLFSKDKKKLIRYPLCKEGAYTIPNGVVTICNGAFDVCKKLTTLTIPQTVTKIETYAFFLCDSLKEVYYPEGLIIHSVFSNKNKPKLIAYSVNTESPKSINASVASLPQEKSIHKSDIDMNIPTTGIVNSNTFVIIVANENYKNVASVPFAKNDGSIFQQYCNKTLGIPHTNIHYVENASYNDIRLELAWLENVCKKYEGEASIIFYYAGHGIPDASDKSSYLLPIDGDGRYVATGYKLDELYQKLGDMPSKSVVVLLDACFSGANKDGKMLASERGVALKSRPGQPQGNMVVFSAAQSDETALPNNEEKHGMFTYYILKKLQETKGDVTLKDLSDYVIREVGRTSAVINKPQTPTITPSVTLGSSWQSWKLK